MVMKSIIKYSLITILILGVVSVVAFNIYSKEKDVLFSATDTSLTEDVESGRLIYSATITNRGDKPVEIEGCGYNDARCEEGCGNIGVINPGEEFVVEISCESGVTLEDLKNARFYIRNRFEGQSESQTTSSGTPLFPPFNLIIRSFISKS